MAGLALGASVPRRQSALVAADRWLSRRAAWIAACAAVLTLQLALTLTHRPWLDEYQALQLALQSPDLAGLMAHLRYEGHPPLWYLLLRGAGAILPPSWVLPAVAAPLALVIQGVVLSRAPFGRIERLGIVTGTFVLFEYATLSRSLTLGVALLLVAFAFRERRWSWIALALLPMADFLFGVLSGILVLVAWREKRLWWPGIAAWLVAGLLAAWSVRPAADVVPAFLPGTPLYEAGVWLNNLSVLLLPIQTVEGRLEWNGPLPLGLASVAGPLFLVFAIRQLRGDPLALALWSGFAGLTLAFSIAAYPLAIRHLSLIALLLILLRWRAVETGEAIDRWFRLWVAGMSAAGLLTAGIALARPFDTAPEAAAAIRRAGLADAHWIAFPDSRGQGVAALTGIAFHTLGRDCTQQFVRWNYRSPIRRERQLERALARVTARYGRVQLLTDFAIERSMSPRFVHKIGMIPSGYDGQEFHLYTVAPALPATATRPPRCVAGQRPLVWR